MPVSRRATPEEKEAFGSSSLYCPPLLTDATRIRPGLVRTRTPECRFDAKAAVPARIMNADIPSLYDGTNWVEELQRSIFDECSVQARDCRARMNGEVSSDDGSESYEPDGETVPISVVIFNIDKQLPSHFRQSNNYLDELKQALRKASSDGKRIGWHDFRNSSKLWFLNVVNAVSQDNNNNVHTDRSDETTPTATATTTTASECSERDEQSCSDTVDDDDNSGSANNQLQTVATCYSLNSSSMGLGTTDSMIEWSDEMDLMSQDVSVDLQVRIRRCNEETTNLKQELLRTEETISSMESDVKSKEATIEKLILKYSRLQKEFEDQKEMLAQAERREESCKLELRTLEKAYTSLQKKIQQLEKEKEDAIRLNTRIDELNKENLEYIKQLTDYKNKYEKKRIECEYLQEEYHELQNSHSELEKTYEKNLQGHLEKIQELQNLNAELQSKLNSNDSSNSGLSVTPPPYVNTHIHSTPHAKKKVPSLYSELKASGFDIEEAKTQDLKNELSFYNEEIAIMSDQIDEALQELAVSRNKICTPSVQLVETNNIQTLKQKIASLLKLMKDCPVGKEPMLREDCREKPDVLPQPKKGGYLFDDRDFASDKGENDLIGSTVPTISVNGIYDRSTSPLEEISGVDRLETTDDSQEPEVIIPIHEALKRIDALKAVDDETSTAETNKRPPLYPKQQSIFTYNKKSDWSNLVAEASKVLKTHHVRSDGTFCLKREVSNGLKSDEDTSSSVVDMKTIKNESKVCETSGEDVSKSLDTRYVTLSRPDNKTFVFKPLISSTVEKSSFDEVRSEIPYRRTPDCQSTRVVPRRKLSVYHRSFDIDSLQTPDRTQSVVGGEKKRSVSTSDVQESESYREKSGSTQLDIVKDQLLLTDYRCPGNSSAELSDSSTKNDSTKSLEQDLSLSDEKMNLNRTTSRPIILAPTKFNLPDSTLDQTTINQTTVTRKDLEFTPMVGKGILTESTIPEFRTVADKGIVIKDSAFKFTPAIGKTISNKDFTSELTSAADETISTKDSALDFTPSVGKGILTKNPIQECNSTREKGVLIKDFATTSTSVKEKKTLIEDLTSKLAPTVGKASLIKNFTTEFSSPADKKNVIKNSTLQFTPVVGKGIFAKTSSVDKTSENDVAHHSRILSSSADLIKREGSNDFKPGAATFTIESSTNDSFKLMLDSTDISSNTNLTDSQNKLDSVCLPNYQTYQLDDKTYVKGVVEKEKQEEEEEARTREAGSGAPEENAPKNSSSSSGNCGGGGTESPRRRRSDGGSLPPTAAATPSAAVVGRAMSSGEDSSAESECDARKNGAAVIVGVEEVSTPKPEPEPVKPLEGVDGNGQATTTLPARTRSNSCTETGRHEEKVKTPPLVNGDNKEENSHKVSNSSAQELVKEVIKEFIEDESAKAFPSWTDEKLQESGIATFPDIDKEISENLSEEELKKKFTAFSIGLKADRMTLSKRITLSRRHRDQAEKNFTNEVHKMQQDIKDLSPLCVDSESLERVERVKQQLEMVSRCAHRISCSAETLGAVHQERRVSRAVLLADKYLLTLRAKCDKLANELAETKRILAENNIVLEENLSEMGDDVPRVRYRAVPNNNRTMMARRRASIATISRPLMGSNQDISKEVSRQRNSVSGRVPGVRRPSLCYEAPKWEIDKLDRTDSSSSITELREIFEQAESRRHSREENNNIIRASINNLSTITSDHVEEEEIYMNPREEIVPDFEVNNETHHVESRQQHRHPLICWLLARYAAWKLMLWVIFIAFILGIFVDRVVSSSKRSGPPLTWWSLEELFSQYVEMENEKYPVPRPI